MKKIKIIILSLLVISLFSGCKDPEIIDSQRVKQKICDMIWLYDYSPSDLKVIDWVYNINQIGDDFTGYFVTYEANNGESYSYILASVIEFDNTKKFEVEVVANERYLSEVREYVDIIL